MVTKYKGLQMNVIVVVEKIMIEVMMIMKKQKK
jgi:hypothetical protein